MRSWLSATLVVIGLTGWGCGQSQTDSGADVTIAMDAGGPAEDTADGSTREDAAPELKDDATEPADAIEEPQPGCTEDADCDPLTAALAPCRVAKCEAETCVAVPVEGWTLCDDEDPCTQNDTCTDGVCEGAAISGCASVEGPESDIVIHEVQFDGPDNTVRSEFVELFNLGEEAVDLSGWTLEGGVHFGFPEGTSLASGAYLVVAEDPDTLFALHGTQALGPYLGKLSSDGERLTLRDAGGDLADEVDLAVGYPWPVGGGGSIELIHPLLDNDLGGSWRASKPVDGVREATPGTFNSTAAINPPPQSRQVAHAPQTPKTGEPTQISVKVTDPQGVAGVTLDYQVVLPGAYIPAQLPVPHGALMSNPYASMTTNPTYHAEANWVTVPMNDEGDDGDAEAEDNRYTVTLPPQSHRTLVRYRIRVQDLFGAHITVPYEDDASLNFAYFVYDGVPAYEDHPVEVMDSLPVYILLARAEDIQDVTAYNGGLQIPKHSQARFAYNWPVTVVHNGIVYDNIRFRLRGGNGRYQLAGKRTYRFRFNRGSWLAATDALGTPYPRRWRTLTTGKGFDNRQTLSYDVNCVINSHLMRAAGVPAPRWNWFHLRVVDGTYEAPDQWTGDFWGLHSAVETYDKRYLESHGLDKGNLYKLVDSKSAGVDQLRYQGPDAVNDGSDHDNIEQNLTGNSSAEFIRAHVNLPNWYAYHGVAEAVRHYDFWPSANKNQAYYFSPDYEPDNSGYGRLWVLPWDSDASWGPSWNNGHDAVYNALYPANGGGSDGAGTPELHHEYMNVVREIRDLLWQPDQIEPLLDRLTGPLLAFAAADRLRWTGGPSEVGSFNGLGGAGATSLEALVDDLKAFAFVGGNWPGGAVGPGGRGAHLDTLQASGGEGGMIPATPEITYLGAPAYPTDGLSFASAAVSDPQGDESVSAIAWRIAHDGSPDLDPAVELRLEMVALWESGPLPLIGGLTSSANGVIPVGVTMPGETYRVRARALDETGRWSHWSAPHVFTAGPPEDSTSGLSQLHLTEVMYNPAAPLHTSPYSGSDLEFLELHNAGATALALGGAQLQGGVSLTFPVGASVEAGGFLVVARDPEAFESRYGAGLPLIGPYDGKLNNGGESISLVSGEETVMTWTYDDGDGWPERADGYGSSLEVADPSADLTLPSSWRASSELHGSPGWAGVGPSPSPVVNELVADPGEDGAWLVELYNPTDEDLDIGGWWLGVAPTYDAFAVPFGELVPAGGYVTLGVDPVMTLPPYEGGGALWLLEPGMVHRIADQATHGAGADGESWGRWPSGQGPLVPMSALTLGEANAAPRIGPVVISELMVTPSEVPDGVDIDDLEYLEVHNPSDWPEALGGWELTGGVDMTFADATWLDPGATLLVLPFDPTAPGNAQRLLTFREHHDLTDTTALTGGYDGSLSDTSEAVSLWRLTETGTLRLEDGVSYGAAALSEAEAGDSLHRLGPQSLGLEASSWLPGTPTPGAAFTEP